MSPPRGSRAKSLGQRGVGKPTEPRAACRPRCRPRIAADLHPVKPAEVAQPQPVEEPGHVQKDGTRRPRRRGRPACGVQYVLPPQAEESPSVLAPLVRVVQAILQLD